MCTKLIKAAESEIIPAVNFHFWKPCNMRCKFCFAGFEHNNQLSKKQVFEVVRQIAKNSVQKITFVGGEPMLCPWFSEILAFSKSLGLTTMIVTNASLLSETWLASNAAYTDWITLSVDSLIDDINLTSGRALGGTIPLPAAKYYSVVRLIKKFEIRLKINTTVSSYNLNENLCDFILFSKPDRWKIFQVVLGVHGQNDRYFDDCKISSSQFWGFIEQHRIVQETIPVVFEDNDAMINSYLMVDPSGRFFDNSAGYYRYSEPIWKVGWKDALREITFDMGKFMNRGGTYKWAS